MNTPKTPDIRTKERQKPLLMKKSSAKEHITSLPFKEPILLCQNNPWYYSK